MKVKNYEMLLSGYINMMNLVRLNPKIMETLPLFKLAMDQLKEGIGEENIKGLDV